MCHHMVEEYLDLGAAGGHLQPIKSTEEQRRPVGGHLV